MPSPFPGMDPYLEAPEFWRGVHHRLITYIADTLSAGLPSGYLADIDERLIVVQADRVIYPDTLVSKHSASRPRAKAKRKGTDAILEADPAMVVTLEAEERTEAFINIRLANEGRRVITSLEVISPTNKTAGDGRQQYEAKQRQLLGSAVHLLEIDLLRQGLFTIAAPYSKLALQTRWEYVASLHRGGRASFEVWPVTVRQRLPRVLVPLAEDDPDYVLNLQDMVDHCYDAGNYGDRIDYRQDPFVPLRAEDAEWADALLRKRRLRSGKEKRS